MEETREKDVLEDIGLTENEAKVYLTLLETGSTTAGVIVKKTNLHRSTTYEIIRRMIETGMINYVIKAGKRYFEATDPEKFLDVMKEREEKLRSILPQLKMKKDIAKIKQEAYIYEGSKGVKTIFEDVLKTLEKGGEYLIFGAGEPTPMHEYLRIFELRRSKKKIPLKIIFSEGAKLIDYYRKVPYTKVRVLPEENMTPSEVEIFGDKTAIILWGEKPMAFVIENKEVADSFRKYFNLVWEQDVMIHKGYENVLNLFRNEMLKMKKNETYYVFGVTYGEIQKNYLKKWFVDYHKERLKRGVRINLLCDKKIEKTLVNEIISAGDAKFDKTEIRFFPFKISTPVQINIYQSKSIIFIFGKDALAFEMENKDITENFRNYFESVWKMSRPFKKIKNTSRF